MRVVTGDIWDYHAMGAWAVIPTNLQYNRSGAVMGAGLARQAVERYPAIKQVYGRHLELGYQVMSLPQHRLFFLPTKDRWKDPSDLGLISYSLKGLVLWSESYKPQPFIAVPKLGCGLGGLNWTVVRPLIEEHLLTPNFALVIPANETI